MKKILSLILLVVMIIGTTAFAYADTDDLICELDPESRDEMLEIHKAFLDEQVKKNLLTEEEAAKIYERLEAKENLGVMRGLGFGSWLRDQEEFEGLYEQMPHKGFRGGNNGFTYEEKLERRETFGCRGKGGGFRYNIEDAE